MNKWIGSGNDTLCKDPKRLNEALLENADTVVDYITYETYNKGYTPKFPVTNSTIWHKIDRNDYGRCYTAKPTKEIIAEGIEDVYIRTKTNVRVYFHTPGLIRTNRQVYFTDIRMNKEHTFNGFHEVVHLLPNRDGFGCNPTDPTIYSKDLCTEELVTRVSKNKSVSRHRLVSLRFNGISSK